MFIPPQVSTEGALRLIGATIDATRGPESTLAPKGLDVEIKPHVRPRSWNQNRFLHAICARVVAFWHETGFMPDGMSKKIRFINSDFVKEYFKARFDVKSTAKMSTKECYDFCEKVQLLMVEQSGGQYEPIYPPERDYFEQTGLKNE